jgi:hypothetical protein
VRYEGTRASIQLTSEVGAEDAKSDDHVVRGMNDWTRIEQELDAPPAVGLVGIRLTR